MNKTRLRKEYLLKRGSQDERELKEKNSAIKKLLISTFEFNKFKVLHHFLSITENNEVDTRFLVDAIKIENPNIRIVVPRVKANTKELEHLELKFDTVLAKSEWGILEPVGDELVSEKLIDIVLVPLLCFDKNGHRVGYGGGYYDKFLAKCRPDCLKIGLSHFPPVEEIEDIHEKDVKLDYCVTPGKIYGFSEK